MSDVLVLMRHGKAKHLVEDDLTVASDLEQADLGRDLTQAGKTSLKKTLPESLKLIPREARIRIWSSPANRALQTARIVKEACAKAGIRSTSKVETVNALWEGDLEAIVREARLCDDDIVFAVGHIPFVEHAVERLTDASITFETGGFAAIDLVGAPERVNSPAYPRLLWFVQGPVSQRWKALSEIEDILKAKASEVQLKLDAFFADPDDIETAHKLRVSIRTLRSLVAFISPWQKRAQNKAIQRDLRAVVLRTSRLRELDVFAEQAAEGEDATPEFVEYCKQKASEERQHTMAVLSSKKMQQHLKRAFKQIAHIEWLSNVRSHGLGALEMRENFDRLLAETEAEFAALDLADVEQTHYVRKQAKRARYDAENFQDLMGEDTIAIAKAMTDRQDNLGAICDARVNIATADAFLAENPPEPIAWDLTLFRAKNETFLYTTLREASKKAASCDAPSPEEAEAPAPEEAEAPTLEEADAPAPEVTVEPDPEAVDSPSPEVAESLSPETDPEQTDLL